MYCRTKVSVHINRSVRSDFVLKLFTNFWAGEWEQNLCAIVELFFKSPEECANHVGEDVHPGVDQRVGSENLMQLGMTRCKEDTSKPCCLTCGSA